MATVWRKYDDDEILYKLQEIRPGLRFEEAHVTEIEVLPQNGVPGSARTIELTVEVRVLGEEFSALFNNPTE